MRERLFQLLSAPKMRRRVVMTVSGVLLNGVLVGLFKVSRMGVDPFQVLCAGLDAVKRKIREIENKKDATAVEQNLLTTLEVCYEFYLRGYHFDTIDIYRSDATKFLITDNGLLPPFISVHGLGEAAAQDTVEKRTGKTFVSVEEFSLCCTKLSKTHIEQLKGLGAFAGMADTSQITLF